MKWIGLALVAALWTGVAAAQPPVVETDRGRVQGVEEGGLNVYRGIPFAAPPTGDRRWRAPQPAEAWQGVRAADRFGPICRQPAETPGPPGWGGEAQDEDCLRLNIWAPPQRPGERLPVMVWIHGGAYIAGSGSTSSYHGDSLARRGVVVVTINYRVGALGFLAHPALSAESPDRASGNYGLLDQIAALRWVRDNIAAFGGDPGNVTIFGESAGGGSVMLLTVSPLARGLFHKAISESGAALPPQPRGYQRPNATVTLAQAERAGAAFARQLGAASLSELRALPADRIVAAQSFAVGWPIADGPVVPGDVTALYRAGRQTEVPFLLGWNEDEGTVFVRPQSPAQHRTTISNDYGPSAERMLAIYPAANDQEAFAAGARLFGDVAFGWPSWSLAEARARSGGAPLFLYHFTQKPPRPPMFPWPQAGTLHGEEVPYVFGHAGPGWTDGDRAVAELVQSYWVNFARTGDPNASGLPAWQPYRGDGPVLWFGNGAARPGDVPASDRLRALDAILGG